MYCSRHTCAGVCACDKNNKNKTENNKTVEIYRGSQLTLNFKFPFSISDKTFEVMYAGNEALKNPVVEVIDEFNIRAIWSSDKIELLPLATKNSFRIGLTFSDGSKKNYNNLWVVVK